MNVTRPVTYITSIVDEGPTEAPDVPTTYVHFVAPTGIETGDFMLAAITTPLGSNGIIIPPDGWTLIQRIDNSGSLGLALYYRFALDEPDRYVWTITWYTFIEAPSPAITVHIGTMSVYRNVWDFAPVDAFAGQGLRYRMDCTERVARTAGQRQHRRCGNRFIHDDSRRVHCRARFVGTVGDVDRNGGSGLLRVGHPHPHPRHGQRRGGGQATQGAVPTRC
jgi:hypothetical protein